VRTSIYRPDGLTEKARHIHVENKEALRTTLETHWQAWGEGPGAIGVLYSCILTRGCDVVRSDMDYEGCTLIGAHGYCTQEMVNLLVSGRASSNVFDGVQILSHEEQGGMKLKGIHKRPPVGLLTLFEAYGSLSVGDRLKNPLEAVWLVCSESHFSVLFSARYHTTREGSHLLAFPLQGEAFDLFYYDGLARQEVPIRLSVYPTGDPQELVADHRKAKVPPLELVIGTKWGQARIDWNGHDRIL